MSLLIITHPSKPRRARPAAQVSNTLQPCSSWPQKQKSPYSLATQDGFCILLLPAPQNTHIGASGSRQALMWLNCFAGTLKEINYNQLRCEKAGWWQKPGTTLLGNNWSLGGGMARELPFHGAQS